MKRELLEVLEEIGFTKNNDYVEDIYQIFLDNKGCRFVTKLVYAPKHEYPFVIEKMKMSWEQMETMKQFVQNHNELHTSAVVHFNKIVETVKNEAGVDITELDFEEHYNA